MKARSKKSAISKRGKLSLKKRPPAPVAPGGRFDEVLTLIDAARRRAYQAVNTELVGLYWELGAYISTKLATAEWGDGVVAELAFAIAEEYPGVRGYTPRNLFRMRQFYEAYRDAVRVTPLVTQLPWTHHLIIMSQAVSPEEREFYILATIQGRWSKRELERQIHTKAFQEGREEPQAGLTGALPNSPERDRALRHPPSSLNIKRSSRPRRCSAASFRSSMRSSPMTTATQPPR